MHIELLDMLLYTGIILLQIGDWITTKLGIAQEGAVVETNPFGRKEFEAAGGVPKKLLIIKILVALLIVGNLIFLRNVSDPKILAADDIVVGVAFWYMLYVVLSNATLLLRKLYMNALGIREIPLKEKDGQEIISVCVNNAFYNIALTVFLFCIAVWIWHETQRSVMFGTALASCAMCMMEFYNVFQLRKNNGKEEAVQKKAAINS